MILNRERLEDRRGFHFGLLPKNMMKATHKNTDANFYEDLIVASIAVCCASIAFRYVLCGENATEWIARH